LKPHKAPGVRKSFSLIRETGACMRHDCANRGIKCGECCRINGKDTDYEKREEH
jgi:hypothetical protein